METRIRIGISSCLLGEPVRFDGGHKRDAFLTDVLGQRADWVSVCPEVEVGMGTPREPVRLVRENGRTRMLTVNTSIDHTDAMNAWARRRLEALAREDLDGYVLKQDSPSCGMDGVKIYGPTGPTRDGRGLFAEALLARFPLLPVEEEGRLADPGLRQKFLERADAYRRLKAARAPYRRVDVLRVGRSGAGRTSDYAAAEEPLEVRLHGRPFAVIMRTPGLDRELTAGFLLSESIIHSHEDLGAVEHCRHPDHPDVHNVVDVYLVGDAARALDAHLEQRRNVTTSSSCGLCGRVTIESLRRRVSPLVAGGCMKGAVAAALPERLRPRQAAFDETGGLHAAALFDLDGTCQISAEDVGRHNAVDKVIGAMLLAERTPLHERALLVSGRASFEIVQKAWLAGIPIVCAVSAPSSLAIDLAREAGITLLGFVRDGGFNVYSHEGRIAGV